MSGTCYLSGMHLIAEDINDDALPESLKLEPADSGDLSSARIEILNQFDDQEALKVKITYSTSYSFTLIFNDAICAGMSFEKSSLMEKVTLNLIGLTEHFDLKYIIIKDKGIIAILKRFSQRRQTLSKPTIDPQTFYSKGKKNENVVFESFSRQELAFRYFDEMLSSSRSDLSKSPLKLFAFESLMTGKRQFLVADLNTFMIRYLNLEASQRHVYELIRQDFPCRLYFDLEYSIPANPGINGQVLVERWIHIVSWKLFEMYGLVVGRGNFIDLDSSSDIKFSRHVTVLLVDEDEDDDCAYDTNHSPASKRRKINKSKSLLPAINGKEYLFRNNIECGHFVDMLVGDVLLLENGTLSSTDPEASSPLQLPRAHCHKKTLNPSNSFLFVWNKERTAKTCFVDVGVYTRNRVFRLFSSCKHGKSSRLKVTSSHVIVAGPPTGSSAVNYYVKKSDCDAQVSHHELFSQILSRTFVVPPHVMRSSTYLENEKADKGISMPHQLLPTVESAISLTFTRHTRQLPPSSLAQTISTTYVPSSSFITHKDLNSSLSIQILATSQNSYPITLSPFPQVDNFVTSLACRGGSVGRISQWLLKSITSGSSSSSSACVNNTKNTNISDNSATSTTKSPSIYYNQPTICLEYQIAGNRFCQNINRPHKSNNILFEVNLCAGYVRQKCWDIDCRGFRSDPVYIPQQDCPTLQNINEIVGDIVIKNALLQDPSCI